MACVINGSKYEYKYDTTVQLSVAPGYILAISFEKAELFKVNKSSMYLMVVNIFK